MTIKCPDCSNINIKDEGDGIMSCKSCDLIFDAGPQWIRYNPNDDISDKLEFRNNSTLTPKTVLKWQEKLVPEF